MSERTRSHSPRRRRTGAVLLPPVLALLLPLAPAQEKAPHVPDIKPASREGERAIAAFEIDPEFRVHLFAAEPMVANPVAFSADGRGRLFVAEAFRRAAGGVADNRDFPEWQDDDLRSETLEDRAVMVLKHHPEFAEKWTVAEDRVRLLIDRDRDGRADGARVFAGGFRDLLDGIGAGVLSRGSTVYYTCIPHLWALHDEDGDGAAERRTALHRGFGVRVALFGHDLHGLRIGPDGRLYFSIGDRGYDVRTPDGRRLHDPRSGAVFRCELDGSALEVFATGFRNPQELAFDDLGNLVTCDNNSDGEDRARIVHVVEGGITGWRMNFQVLPRRGPWVGEGWWRTRHDGQAAFLIPPVAHLGNGPSGLAFYPGAGLPERFRGHFFLCDFLGTRARSGVRAFALEPDGAGLRLRSEHWFLKGLLATDADFDADGTLYVSDWVEGWKGCGKGRIYGVRHPVASRDPAAREAARLLSGGLDGLPAGRLRELLAHPHREVRQEAQFALAGLGPEGEAALLVAARRGPGLLARLHALWGLGQIGRREPKALGEVSDLLRDRDPEVRAQAARVLGEARLEAAAPALRALLPDPAPRARFFAAMALGRIGDRRAVDPIIEMLRRNDDADLHLRHAGVMALDGIGDRVAALRHGADRSAAVRLAVVLALRRWRDPRVADFLTDRSPAVAREAALAVYDVPIPEAYGALAALLGRTEVPGEPFTRRAIAAHDLLGGAENAAALAAYAARETAPEAMRVEALEALLEWGSAPVFDRVLKDPRQRPARSAGQATEALAPRIDGLLRPAPDPVREVAARIAGRHRLETAVPPLRDLAGDPRAAPGARIAALRALAALGARGLAEAASDLLGDREPLLRAEAARTLAALDPERALPLLLRAAETGSVAERQTAIEVLGRMKHPRADRFLAERLDALLEDRVSEEVRLDLLEAARRRAEEGQAELRKNLARYDAALPEEDPIARHLPALAGGDAGRGRAVFEKGEAQCRRCHSLGRDARELPGPDLRDVGARVGRRHILESIVDPDRRIAHGFQNVLVEKHDGTVLQGRLLSETDRELRLEVDGEGGPKEVTVDRGDVVMMENTVSSMPSGLADALKPRELRDLVEFLASLRGEIR